MTYRHAIVIAVGLGLVAACVVWYLERFETNRLFGEMREYMTKQDQFREWLKTKESGSDG
jgi:hypothetical protein